MTFLDPRFKYELLQFTSGFELTDPIDRRRLSSQYSRMNSSPDITPFRRVVGLSLYLDSVPTGFRRFRASHPAVKTLSCRETKNLFLFLIINALTLIQNSFLTDPQFIWEKTSLVGPRI